MKWSLATATCCRFDPGGRGLDARDLILITFDMVKRTTKRLLAVAVVLALALLVTHAASHWHSHEYDQDRCQICHVGHTAVPQAVAQVAMQATAQISRLALAIEFAPKLDFVGSLSIPRAPPA
jgi:hypothetical protein